MTKMPVKARRCFFLFLFVFGLWQAMEAFVWIFLPPELLRQFIFLIVQIIYVSVFILFIKLEGSSFEEHGFRWPETPEKYLASSLLFALIYILIILFLPGSIYGFKAFPFVSLSLVTLESVKVLSTSLASESIFRGYIQSNLTRAYGFFPALSVSSVMFSLYRLSFLSLLGSNSISTCSDVVIFFMGGLFLGFLFQKTGSLLSGVTFSSAVSILYYVTPLKVVAGEFTTLLFVFIGFVLLIFLLHVLRVSEAK